MIAIPRNVIAAISTPLLAQAWKRNDSSQIEEIYRKSSLNLLLVGCFLFLLIWCNLDFIYQIIPRHEIYEAGKWVVLMVGISKIIDMGTGLNSEILINSKFYRYDLFFYMVLALCVVIGNLIFIPMYSYNGAALAALMALAIYNTIKFLFIWKKMGLQPFEWKTALIVLVSLGIYGIVEWIPVMEGSKWVAWGLNIGVRSMVIGILFVGAGWIWHLSPDLEEMIKTYLKK